MQVSLSVIREKQCRNNRVNRSQQVAQSPDFRVLLGSLVVPTINGECNSQIFSFLKKKSVLSGALPISSLWCLTSLDYGKGFATPADW